MGLLKQNGTMKLRDFIEPLAKYFRLSDYEANEIYPSGNGNIFYDRVSWALSYLNMAGLVDKPRRGVYKINESGLKLLNTPEKVHEYIETQLEKREPTRLETPDIVYHPRRVKVTIAGRTKVTHPRRAKVTHL